MELKIKDKTIPVQQYSNSTTEITVWMKDTLAEDQMVSLMSGEAIQVMDDEGNPTGVTLPPIKMLNGLAYSFALRTKADTDLEALESKLAEKEHELDQAIHEARNRLVSPPSPGEEWVIEKWYCSGDTVLFEGEDYTCQKTCKGRHPNLADYWAVTPQVMEPILWGDIPSGDTIAVGTIVTHNELTWRCVKEHTKSIVRQPSKVQTDYWEVVA